MFLGWVTRYVRDSLLRKLQTKQELSTKFDVDFILQFLKEYIIHNFMSVG